MKPNIYLSQDDRDLAIEGINQAIAICDYDSYNDEEYDNPRAQVSWYERLIEKFKHEL